MRTSRTILIAVLTAVSILTVFTLTRTSSLFSQAAGENSTGRRSWSLPLHPTTGFNDLCGSPVFDGAPNMPFSAAYNPDGQEPIRLTSDFCRDNPDALLASWANPEFYAANGWPLPDDRLLNIPYHQIPVPGISWDGTRSQVPAESPGQIGGPPQPGRSTPNQPETVASFTDVTGTMDIRCSPDGTAKIRIQTAGYKPNSVATVWIVWGMAPDSGFPPVVPRPLGGVPNTAVANKHGHLRFVRQLAYCPMDTQTSADGVTMTPLTVDIATHPDGVTYGGYPEHPLAEFTFVDSQTGERFTSKGIGAGMVTMDQGAFPLRITESSTPNPPTHQD